ncbi:MBOAT family O-acyltransferase [Janthinobacterium agaricidamnosum]|uniref:Probable alginate O-acetylase AlgI n=1 Tax=Janthinobacterium agaricidamnosum NBRC 102515 = DSM 9628 TaxID=1349767 RepID=W0VAK2_9BURK|nr:MBOAT family protein [Janthinobacterium agaricidamnosum]CDG84620.1 MBOAT family protein [Janthinobacterium agaricidamnosum NBRC 102515 = DSM 9628]
MLFNSFPFFLVFLPLALLAYFVLSTYSLRLSIIFLLLASIAFYCYWDIAFLPLLGVSICSNFVIGRAISQRREVGRLPAAKTWLVCGLVFNLSLLVFFKYADFLIGNLAWLTGAPWRTIGIALPIGISFFTFTQIAYLVDCHAGKVKDYQPESYGLFVTYFPHLIAGPILHHKDMMPQFERPASHVFSRGRIVVGLSFFTIGLFKKVILADGVARFVGPVFDLHYHHLSMLEAWAGALAYTFQLYFDFSAYSDMAYGLSYLFGIVLPINFDSPYKATSIIEFWRRWHITLSNFLRDYLYIPLGGNRKGSMQRYLNLLITMVLGGLWHGANWTYLLWGALHGLYLIVNHALRRLLGGRDSLLIRVPGAAATFLAVVLAWVFFRAASVPVALDLLNGMAGGTLTPAMQGTLLGVNRIMQLDMCLWWLAACAMVAFLLPNAYQLLGRGMRPEQERALEGTRGSMLLGALLMLCFLLLAISETRGVSEFLYFNF